MLSIQEWAQLVIKTNGLNQEVNLQLAKAVISVDPVLSGRFTWQEGDVDVDAS